MPTEELVQRLHLLLHAPVEAKGIIHRECALPSIPPPPCNWLLCQPTLNFPAVPMGPTGCSLAATWIRSASVLASACCLSATLALWTPVAAKMRPK